MFPRCLQTGLANTFDNLNLHSRCITADFDMMPLVLQLMRGRDQGEEGEEQINEC